MGNHNARDQRWLEVPPAFDYTLEYRNGRANGNADFLFRLPVPTTEHDRSGSTIIKPVEDGDVYLRACGLSTPFSPITGVGMGALVPGPESAFLGGLRFTSAEFDDFGTNGPWLRIDNLSALSGSFVARVSASITNVNRCSGRGRFSHTLTTFKD